MNPSPTPSPSSVHNKPSSKSNTGAIAGGVVGGLLGLTVIAFLIYLARRRRRRQYPGQAPKSSFARKVRTKPTLLRNWINSNDATTYYEKDAQQRAELSPADRFEIGGDHGAAAHELDAANGRR